VCFDGAVRTLSSGKGLAAKRWSGKRAWIRLPVARSGCTTLENRLPGQNMELCRARTTHKSDERQKKGNEKWKYQEEEEEHPQKLVADNFNVGTLSKKLFYVHTPARISSAEQQRTHTHS
jgi:hypothetical protein